MPEKPRVECKWLHPVIPVPNVQQAIDYYTSKLAFEVGFTAGEPPTVAGLNLGVAQMLINEGAPNPDGCAVHFVITDVDRLFAFQSAGGVTITEPPEDKPWGMRQYAIEDPWGYKLIFGQHLHGPKLEIERVDVPVRFEKRLAALLGDLAKHKNMTDGECLEEVLLHSFEATKDGVASPHTPNTMLYIEELKQKHGIDYDTHASYRFVEKSQ
jgi:uncharacterized glyoxalase superfamily protein PhnB